MLKISAVSYLNTKPFLYGIFKSGLEQEVDLQLDIPSECARKLTSGEVDMALLPVAAIPDLGEAHVVSDFCIGATGAVKTVCIFADRPLEELTHIYLDYHSRTSVELTRILLSEHWKLNPVLLPAKPGFETEIRESTGALVIGDRAIDLHHKHAFAYDLGEAWVEFSGKPFVFAAWVSRQALDPGFEERFNKALQTGIDQIPQLVYILPTPQPGFDLKAYFTENISYPLDADKKEGLKLFLSHLGTTVPHL
ncbi:MAG: ABC transporter substrate-binding protein [Saprospirales bacterium]|nr:ABC transporter substrate-binding protein [Saprospirales bacterium]